MVRLHTVCITCCCLLIVVEGVIGVMVPNDCTPSFELMSGVVFIGTDQMMETKQGVLHLAECIEFCRRNASCHAVNFETGFCVLFAVSPDRPGVVAKSQEPVFTLFARKICLPARGPPDSPPDSVLGSEFNPCAHRAWSYEVVSGHALNVSPRRRAEAASRISCMALCLAETSFVCRSANFNSRFGECQLNELDRFSLPVTVGPVPSMGPTASVRHALSTASGVDFLESNCVQPAINRLCNFTQIGGKILKTVDAVHENVGDMQACRELCVAETEFACRTFDFGETGYQECRLSHHSLSSVEHLEEPYLEMPDSSSYQLAACYNVNIECGASSMVARFEANKAFSGKIYAKSRPSSCSVDVDERLEFAIELPYHDRDCGVRVEGPGKYATEIVLQHHKLVVTSQDVGLAARCAYSLSERSVGLGVQMELLDTTPADGANWEDTAFVDSPVVSMRITNRQGGDVRNAQVGDALSLRFQIADRNSPYEMFVRELIAMDGLGESEVLLIDSLGCPTDPTIMGAITVVANSAGKTLQAPFDAFKFPGSQVVQFKALVTPCLPSCEPVRCQLDDLQGVHDAKRQVGSLGKRRRRRRRRDVSERSELFAESVRTSTQRLLVVDMMGLGGPGTAAAAGGGVGVGSVVGVGLLVACAVLAASRMATRGQRVALCLPQ